jgi:hypothetical protein
MLNKGGKITFNFIKNKNKIKISSSSSDRKMMHLSKENVILA